MDVRLRRSLFVYVGVTWLVSWGYWGWLIVTGREVGYGAAPTHFPGLLGPALGAIAAAAVLGPDARIALKRRAARWRMTFREWMIALSPLAFLALGLAVARVVDGYWAGADDFGRFTGLPVVPVAGIPLLVVIVLVVNGFGEELGWRGLLHPTLRGRFGLARAVLLTWALWGVWHVPLFAVNRNFGGFDPVTLVGYWLGLAAGAVVLAWVIEETGSVPAAALWHTFYNFGSAPAAAEGVVQSVTTTCVMITAAVIVRGWWRQRRRAQP